MKNQLSLLIFTIFICSLIIVSCSDENGYSNDISNKTNELMFNSLEEYRSARKAYSEMNKSERIKWESTRGFTSFVRECEEFYKEIDFESFNSKTELLDFVEKNSNYLIFNSDEDGEVYIEPILSRNRNRYFANKGGIFFIQDKAYKVLEEATIVAHTSNIDILLSIDETNYLSFLKDESLDLEQFEADDIIKKSTSIDCGLGDEKRQTDGRDRTKFELRLKKETYLNGGPFATDTRYYVFADVRPYKKTLGIWYWCSRTITMDLDLMVAIESGVDELYKAVGPGVTFEHGGGYWYNHRYQYYKQEGAYQIEKEATIIIVTNTQEVNYNYHFKALDCSGDTPSTPAVKFECQTFLLN